jgi:DUF4097 and DUF4098 domain-containing protein YvlB
MSHKRRPSLLGALLLIGIGVLFLLRNFGFGPDFWTLARRYWPVLLILLGAGKIIEYFLKKDSVSIRVGEIIGILFLLFFAFLISRIFISPIGPFIPDFPNIEWGPPMPPGQWIGDSHTYTEEENYPFESSMPIRIENSNGSVSISPGSDQEIRVRLKKVIYGSASRAREVADKLHLEGITEEGTESNAALKPEAEPGGRNDGEYFVIRTNRESLVSRDFRFNTDMEITVPKNSQIKIRNTIGEVRVSGINGDLDLSTTLRALEMRDCTGNFTVSNRFADSRLTNLEGNVTLTSRGRGKVTIEDIKGDVSITNDYSPMEILGIDGKVSVSSTEGSLRIERITKPVVIEGRGTHVRVGDLTDSLKISVSHNQSVDIFDIASDVVIESRYCTLSMKNIGGNIQIQSKSDNINADSIHGNLTMEASASSLRLNDIVGNLDIRTTLKDVIVNGFEGSCSVINEYADVSLSARSLNAGNIYVKNRNGKIDLFLPEDSSFMIDAVAENGKVSSDYRGLASARNENNTGVLKSRVGNEGPTITLETEYSNIHISQTRAQERSHISIPGKIVTPPIPLWSFDFDRILSIIDRIGLRVLAKPAESLIGGLR